MFDQPVNAFTSHPPTPLLMAANKTRNTHRLFAIVQKGVTGYQVSLVRKGRTLFQGTTTYTRAQKAKAMVEHLASACRAGELTVSLRITPPTE